LKLGDYHFELADVSFAFQPSAEGTPRNQMVLPDVYSGMDGHHLNT